MWVSLIRKRKPHRRINFRIRLKLIERKIERTCVIWIKYVGLRQGLKNVVETKSNQPQEDKKTILYHCLIFSTEWGILQILSATKVEHIKWPVSKSKVFKIKTSTTLLRTKRSNDFMIKVFLCKLINYFITTCSWASILLEWISWLVRQCQNIHFFNMDMLWMRLINIFYYFQLNACDDLPWKFSFSFTTRNSFLENF